MKKITTPQAGDWNHYWGLDQTQQFTKVSWSKRRIMSLLGPYLKKDHAALDAGCGSGFFSKFFCDQGMKTTAIDYSEKALEIARTKTENRVKTTQTDLTQEHLDQIIEDRFDLIFSDGLLEHFDRNQQNQIVQNFKSLLTDEGVVVTFVPNRWSPWELIRPFYMPGIEEKPFVLKQLVQLHEENGLIVFDKGGLNTLPFAFSPDQLLGSSFGMLLYTITKKKP